MRHLVRRLAILTPCFVLFVLLSPAAFADGGREHTQVGQNINVGAGENVGDLTCFGCSIRVRGHVTGDVTAFGGGIVVEDQGQIEGDATTFGGGIRLDKEVKISGDVTVFGGGLRRDPAASIGGDVTNFGGPLWIFLIFGLPLVFLGAFVALIIWIVRRLMRTPAPAPPATA